MMRPDADAGPSDRNFSPSNVSAFSPGFFSSFSSAVFFSSFAESFFKTFLPFGEVGTCCGLGSASWADASATKRKKARKTSGKTPRFLAARCVAIRGEWLAAFATMVSKFTSNSIFRQIISKPICIQEARQQRKEQVFSSSNWTDRCSLSKTESSGPRRSPRIDGLQPRQASRGDTLESLHAPHIPRPRNPQLETEKEHLFRLWSRQSGGHASKICSR